VLDLEISTIVERDLSSRLPREDTRAVCTHLQSFSTHAPQPSLATLHTLTNTNHDSNMAPRKKKDTADDATKAGKAPAPRRASKASKTSGPKAAGKAGKVPAAKSTNKASKSAASKLKASTEPVLFYGHTKPNGWLSQFYLSEFDHNGKSYVCSEQFFHYAKAAFFSDFVGCSPAETFRQGVDKDQETGDAILKAILPKEQKALGKKVTPFDADAWSNGESQKLVSEVT
jgi:predicted NAD-dependent protein-ADP-ribosyltransferase YbiA (DUF1768 family)